jgi:uncharacterized protein (DUF2235 family)
MAKSIVICCDGTWNRPAANTNIWRTYRLLLEAAGRDPRAIQTIADGARDGRPAIETGAITVASAAHEVVLYYDSGVGTEPKRSTRGGALALGLDVNVEQAYACVQEHWRPGDRIFAFGFSRGAYTARAFCGMLATAGVVPAAADPASIVARARTAYLTPAQARETGRTPADARATGTAGAAPAGPPPVFPTVRFLGVYDTVGALGVPVPRLRFLNRWLFADLLRFCDSRLGTKVEIACQALAIHERRGAFKPVLWSQAPRRAIREDGTVVEQTVHQVWFTGSHGDVGGGAPSDALSNIALNWMLGRAIAAGLPLEPWIHAGRFEEDPRGPRHDSSQGWLGQLVSGEAADILRNLAGTVPVLLPLRPITAVMDLLAVKDAVRRLGGENVTDEGTYWVGVGEQIHKSVLERHGPGYRPANLEGGITCGLPVWHEGEAGEPSWPALADGRGCELANVTTSGLQLRRLGSVALGQEMEIACDADDAPLRRARARVVWTNGDRAGLRRAG